MRVQRARQTAEPAPFAGAWNLYPTLGTVRIKSGLSGILQSRLELEPAG
jgi:hypothetical protein